MRKHWVRMRSQIQIKQLLQTSISLTIGGLLLAFNLVIFLTPAQIAPGGVSGASVLINTLTGFPTGLLVLLLNLPLLGLGYRHLGGLRFLGRTLYTLLLYSFGAEILVRVLPPLSITDDILLSAIFAGVLGGLGAGLVYRAGGTVGGTEIISRILQRRSGVPVSQLYMITDGLVVLAAALIVGWEKALYALIAIFIWGLASDFVLEGPSVVRTVFIITDHPQAVAHAVFDKLHLGLTAWPGTGMYTGRKRSVLFCTISRPDVEALRALVMSVDEEAFLVIGQGHQASGGITRRPLPNTLARQAEHEASPEVENGAEEAPPTTNQMAMRKDHLHP